MDERFTFLVAKYLDQGLTEAERIEFEKYLLDAECADYLKRAEKANTFIDEGLRLILSNAGKKAGCELDESDFSGEIINDVKLYGNMRDDALRKEIKEVHRNMVKRRKRIRLITYFSAAAAVIAGFLILFTYNNKGNSQNIYSKYYLPHEYITFRSEDTTELLYNKAKNAYMERNYIASYTLCKEILASGTHDPQYNFLYGLNLMGLDSMQTAAEQFKIVTTSGISKESYLLVSAHWYASLCYLYLEKLDSALMELDEIRWIDKNFLKGIDVEGLRKGIERLR